MKYLEKFQNFDLISENLKWHLEKNMSVTDNVFRPGSDAYYGLIKETRELFDSGVKINLDENDKELFESTDLGKFGYYKGDLVPLDLPMENIQENKVYDPHQMIVGLKYMITEPDYDEDGPEINKSYMVEVIKIMKHGLILRDIEHDFTFERSFQHLMSCDIEEVLQEAKYHGKEVDLNKPMRSSGPKKYKVYVKDPKSENVRVVNFGDVKGGLSAKVSDPKARKAFASRHQCHLKKDKTKPGYWACRANRYASLWNGKTYPGYW
jgi:hypothetical protein